MTAMKHVSEKERKINVVIMLREAEIKFLDRKIDKKDIEKQSRSALIRLLIHRSMLRPELFDTGYEGA